MKNKKIKWLVMEIGCIECEISSNIIGIYSSEGDALKIACDFEKKLSSRCIEYRVFELPNNLEDS